MNANEITFGIEIECLIPVNVLRSEGWEIGGYHRGRQIPNAPQGWNAQSDCSINTQGDYNMEGVEVVSPVLKGEEGLEQVKAMVARLVACGAKVNASTGLHVHVGVNRNDAGAIARLVCLVANFEKALYAMTGTKSREQGRFCQPIKNVAKIQTVGKSGMIPAMAHHERYHILNLENLAAGRAPAVEFRVFAGTLNIVKMLAYIQVAIGLVHKANESKSRSSWDSKAVCYTAEGKKGQSLAEVNRLLANIGWVQNQKNTKFGLMVDQAALEAMRDELRRLATKYDAAA